MLFHTGVLRRLCQTRWLQQADRISSVSDWARHMVLITQVLDHQVRSLRKLQVVRSLKDGRPDGAYVGIRSDIRKYKVGDRLDAPLDATTEPAEIGTRLKTVPDRDQERLINWGYAIADAGLRAHIDHSLPAPTGYPYARGVS